MLLMLVILFAAAAAADGGVDDDDDAVVVVGGGDDVVDVVVDGDGDDDNEVGDDGDDAANADAVAADGSAAYVYCLALPHLKVIIRVFWHAHIIPFTLLCVVMVYLHIVCARYAQVLVVVSVDCDHCVQDSRYAEYIDSISTVYLFWLVCYHFY